MSREIDPILCIDDGEEIQASQAAEQMLQGKLGLRGLLKQNGISTKFVLHLSRELRENRGRWEQAKKDYLLSDDLESLAQWLSHEMHQQQEMTSRTLAKAAQFLSLIGIFLGSLAVPWRSIFAVASDFLTSLPC